jgi:ABC-type transport system substrate-binding protein
MQGSYHEDKLVEERRDDAHPRGWAREFRARPIRPIRAARSSSPTRTTWRLSTRPSATTGRIGDDQQPVLRLVDYKFGTTEIIPSLADTWTISPDGLVYTFKLNPKAKFTNGRKVAAADIKYSIERSVNPKTQGPAGGFFHSIVGQDKMARSSRTQRKTTRRP